MKQFWCPEKWYVNTLVMENKAVTLVIVVKIKIKINVHTKWGRKFFFTLVKHYSLWQALFLIKAPINSSTLVRERFDNYNSEQDNDHLNTLLPGIRTVS
jgi:hypothetical protein